MKEFNLKFSSKKKKPGYEKGKAYKIFPDLLNQNFYEEKPNQI